MGSEGGRRFNIEGKEDKMEDGGEGEKGEKRRKAVRRRKVGKN